MSKEERLEEELLSWHKAFCHNHVQVPNLQDTACARCGLDLRNRIHLVRGDWPESTTMPSSPPPTPSSSGTGCGFWGPPEPWRPPVSEPSLVKRLDLAVEAVEAYKRVVDKAAAEIRRLTEENERLEAATIGKIEEHHELWLEHEALKDDATRYRKALERIAKILEDDDLQSASKVARAHRVIRHWRKNAALEADHE